MLHDIVSLNIQDGPPGIGCPVIAILVSEPTPSARTSREWLARNEIPLLGEIPYDPHLPRALAHGALAVNMYPDAPSSLAIKELYKAVQGLLD